MHKLKIILTLPLLVVALATSSSAFSQNSCAPRELTLQNKFLLELNNSAHQTVEEFLAKTPLELTDIVIMGKSRSLQPATLSCPRILVISPQAEVMFSFNTDPKAPGYDEIEVITYGGSQGYKTLSKKYSVTPVRTHYSIEENSPRCIKCHGVDAKPIWDPYNFWEGQIPSGLITVGIRNSKDLYESQYLKNFFMQSLGHRPPLPSKPRLADHCLSRIQALAQRQIKKPHKPSITIINGAELFDRLLDLRSCQTISTVKSKLLQAEPWSYFIDQVDRPIKECGFPSVDLLPPSFHKMAEGYFQSLPQRPQVWHMIIEELELGLKKFKLTSEGIQSVTSNVSKIRKNEQILSRFPVYKRVVEDTLYRQMLDLKRRRQFAFQAFKEFSQLTSLKSAFGPSFSGIFNPNYPINFDEDIQHFYGINEHHLIAETEGISPLRYAFEPLGIKVSDWSISKVSRSYTFGDKLLLTIHNLQNWVNGTIDKHTNLDCNTIKQKSLEAFAQVDWSQYQDHFQPLQTLAAADAQRALGRLRCAECHSDLAVSTLSGRYIYFDNFSEFEKDIKKDPRLAESILRRLKLPVHHEDHMPQKISDQTQAASATTEEIAVIEQYLKEIERQPTR